MNKKELEFLLNKYNLTPNKIRGQNFLISDDILDKMISASQISKSDLVLEVGPGLGALTSRLVKEAKQVVAYEVDKNFKRPLDKLAGVSGNLEIFWQDILSVTEKQIEEVLLKHKTNKYKIVANIPYYLTAKFIQKFIQNKHKPETMTLMLQKEVAERIVSKDKKESMLSLSLAFYAQTRIVSFLGKENFYPAPKVDSAVLLIEKIKSWDYKTDEKFTWQMIHRGFASKRKKLINNLLTDPKLDKEKLTNIFLEMGLDLNIRAERLSVDNWLTLVKKIE
jgi:16S rRNA (adenine1518-N6/adenine1519-N6)-dimethyltransferase